MPPLKMSAGQVIDALRTHVFKEPAEIVLCEVRNKTGHGRGPESYADGLAVSLFPSRGIWFAGIEVKVSRSDWKRELANPRKSEPIQRYCNYWWVAAPSGVVDFAELPSTWGLIVVDDKGVAKKVVQAPPLPAEPPSQTFVASVFRSMGQAVAAAESRGFARGEADAQAAMRDREQRVVDFEVAKQKADRESGNNRLRMAELMAAERAVAAFEKASGVFIPGRDHEVEAVAKKVKTAVALFEAMTMARDLDARLLSLREHLSELERNISRHERTEGAAVPQVQETNDG